MKTVGDRIRYFRKDRKMTQDKLAELTGIHPVSIRKYETNKMQPQIEQIERIASVLDVNVSAIVGYNTKPAVVRTVGDLTGVLMMLYKAHILMIIGKPTFNDEDVNKEDFDPLAGMDPQKMLIMLNPMLSSYFDVAKITSITGDFSTGQLSVDQLGLILKKREYAEDFIQWAAIYSLFERVLAANAEKDDPNSQLEFISNSLEELELSLLSSTESLPKEPFDDDSEALFLRFPK